MNNTTQKNEQQDEINALLDRAWKECCVAGRPKAALAIAKAQELLAALSRPSAIRAQAMEEAAELCAQPEASSDKAVLTDEREAFESLFRAATPTDADAILMWDSERRCYFFGATQHAFKLFRALLQSAAPAQTVAKPETDRERFSQWRKQPHILDQTWKSNESDLWLAWQAAIASLSVSAQEQPWVSVSERLPKPFTPVLVQLTPKRKNSKPKFAVAIYCVPKKGFHDVDEPGWFDESTSEDVEPTHWTTLPNAAKQEGEQ